MRYPETLAFIIDVSTDIERSRYTIFNNELESISQVCVEKGIGRAWVILQIDASESSETRATVKELVTKAISEWKSHTSTMCHIHISPEPFDSKENSQTQNEMSFPPVGVVPFDWVFVLDYSAKTDIVRAIQGLANDNCPPERLEDLLPNALIFGGNTPPDLIVYLTGKCRLGEACIWAGAYSEFVFGEKHWSRFGVEDFESALDQYANRNRRFGALGEETEIDA